MRRLLQEEFIQSLELFLNCYIHAFQPLNYYFLTNYQQKNSYLVHLHRYNSLLICINLNNHHQIHYFRHHSLHLILCVHLHRRQNKQIHFWEEHILDIHSFHYIFDNKMYYQDQNHILIHHRIRNKKHEKNITNILQEGINHKEELFG